MKNYTLPLRLELQTFRSLPFSSSASQPPSFCPNSCPASTKALTPPGASAVVAGFSTRIGRVEIARRLPSTRLTCTCNTPRLFCGDTKTWENSRSPRVTRSRWQFLRCFRQALAAAATAAPARQQGHSPNGFRRTDAASEDPRSQPVAM